MDKKKKISFISPCFNEEDNIDDLYRQVSNVWAVNPQFDYEFVIIDNASTDRTVEKLKAIATKDSRLKIIVNTRNFGHIRSPYWGILQTSGDATIYMASDLQDPPDLATEFIKEWEAGYKIVLATKPVSEGNQLVHFLRKLYYRVLEKISDIQLIRDATGFGLYDKKVLDEIRKINDPYPYLRGLICELGYPIKTIEFKQPRRVRGISKNNFYTLYDIAMLGLVSHSLMPIRIASFMGLLIGVLSIFMGAIFLIAKLIWWDYFPVGVAPIAIAMFGLFGMLFIFMGLLGEYIGVIQTHVSKRPIVVESERINFENSSE
jgi:glycosyltransferase involved in cell wall biosynthesis